MKRIVQYGGFFCLCLFFLTGCGQAKVPEAMESSAVSVTKEGTVKAWLVDVFDKDYYALSELEKMAAEEAAAYNTLHRIGEAAAVEVEKVEVLEDGSGKVVVTMEYDGTESFSEFNESLLFYGTVAEAAAAGYDLDAELSPVKEGEALTKEGLQAMQDGYLLITDEKARIYCPRRITHISSGATLLPDGAVDALSAEDTVYILMK